ncbi:hypothetical protein VUR80DRAFT_9342 [Thermomyces stellatus]
MSTTREPRNIYIVGAQCTGKTTLVHELERQFRLISRDLHIGEPRIISEVARTVLSEHPIEPELIRSDQQQSFNLQKLIFAAQVRAEEEALARAPWFLSDRSGFDALVYAKRYAGPEAADEMMLSAEWGKVRDRMAGSVIVVCEAGAPWLLDDGVRLMPEDAEDWIRFHRLFCEMLDEAGLSYHVMPSDVTDLSERANLVISLWRHLNVGG